MKHNFIKSFIKNNRRFFILLVLCSAICFSVFVTFYHLVESIDRGLNSYINDYNYADGIVNINYKFSDEEKTKLMNIDGIYDVHSTFYHEFMSDEFSTVRVTTVNIDKFPLYYVEEASDGDIYLSIDYARANNLKAGDYLNLTIDDTIVPVKIKALVNSPYLLGITRSSLSILETSTYGIAAINSQEDSFLFKYLDHSSVSFYIKDNADTDQITEDINALFNNKIDYLVYNQDLLAIQSIENDINVLKPIATILPIIIYIIGIIISILFIKQFIDTKKREIGILKSMGFDNKYIISLFIGYVSLISIFSFILGIILSIIQIRLYVNLYTNSIYLPIFSVKNNYLIIFIGLIITLISNIIAVILNIKNITGVDSYKVINNIKDNDSRKIKILKNKLITIKPFIASIINNPFRFIFSIINLIFIVIIITASVTVKVAKDNSINYTYETLNNYDYVIHLKNTITNNKDNSFYEGIYSIDNNGKDTYINLTVLNNLDYLNLYDLEGNKINLSNEGVIISEKLSNSLNVSIGDYITINDKSIKIVNISKQTYNFRVIMSYELFNNLYNLNISNSLFSNDYNTINLNNIQYISSTDILNNDINNKFAYIDNYILIIIGVVIFISIIVIFNISIIYYSEKEHTNKTLRTLGYSKGRIILLSSLELVIQAIIALIIGIPLGYYLSLYVTNKISNDYIMIYNNFSNIPIITISIFIICTSVIGRVIASRNRIKLVD